MGHPTAISDAFATEHTTLEWRRQRCIGFPSVHRTYYFE